MVSKNHHASVTEPFDGHKHRLHKNKHGKHKAKKFNQKRHATTGLQGTLVRQNVMHAQRAAVHHKKKHHKSWLDKAWGSVKDRVEDTYDDIAKLEKGGVRDVTHAAASIEHGASKAVGMVESTAVDTIHTGQKAVSASAAWMQKTGQSVLKTARHDVGAIVDFEKESWHAATKETQAIFHGAENVASGIWDFVWPGNWSFGEWILLGGGGLLLTYAFIRTAPIAARGGYNAARTAAPYVAEAAPLLLV